MKYIKNENNTYKRGRLKLSTWAFRRPVTRFKAGDKVEIIRSLNVPGVGTFHTGDVGVVKSVSPSGEPLIEVSGKEPFLC